MSKAKTVKRLIACFGSIQLITALSVLSYREQEQQELNFEYENYLVITPLWAPEGQMDEFIAFIQEMAKSMCSWQKIVHISYEQTISSAKELNHSVAKAASSIHNLLGITSLDELYLPREWRPENKILLNVYASAEKICYGDGIGIYFSQSAFSSPNSSSLRTYLRNAYTTLKAKVKNQKTASANEAFDIGYFSLPFAFGEVPPMKTVILDETAYLKTFQKLSKVLSRLIDINCINSLRLKLQNAPVSILLTSNFSEASGRTSLENEIAAYKEFLQLQGVSKKSVLLIKPHPRDSRNKIKRLKAALNEMYSDIFILNEGNLFYLPFEVLFMEVFLRPEGSHLQKPKIFAFSSACLTLQFICDTHCIIGFGSDLVKRFFYKDHVSARIKHEAELSSAIQEIEANRSTASVSLV